MFRRSYTNYKLLSGLALSKLHVPWPTSFISYVVYRLLGLRNKVRRQLFEWTYLQRPCCFLFLAI